MILYKKVMKAGVPATSAHRRQRMVSQMSAWATQQDPVKN